ncbi:hypothetical protein IV454_16220 [Massilia antarctica]|uniref:Uncharacterized protein n=1 Tax=Massilia antarctica TaxID=2765360 RepID=A0AA49AAQ7_9BURK|nr:hypothetical protein [Massilia antarctica]QPI52893.1 hypothetical protein IV454_16220 [Massilia antarctica]
MKTHFQKHGDEYLLSPAATLMMVADAIHCPDAAPQGKARASRVLNATMAAARAAKFEQADILETMLLSGADAARVLPMCDALVQRLGPRVVIDIIRNGLSDVRQGDGS